MNAQNNLPTKAQAQMDWANETKPFSQLDLTPEQTAQIRELFVKQSQNMNDLLMIEDIAVRTKRTEALIEAQRSRVYALLTREQRAKLDKIRTEYAKLEGSSPADSAPDGNN